MSRLATSFVLGYHGCDATTAQKAVTGGGELLQSDQNYDWLGPGAYFWESDPRRAFEWAQWKQWKKSVGAYNTPAVIGAVIDLGNCLDLVSREDIELLRKAFVSFEAMQSGTGLPMPRNENPKGATDSDRVLRFLDCAVLRHLHESVSVAGLEPYDTVRGMFVEGDMAFPGSGIYSKSHVQIAVRNLNCIKGIFHARLTAVGD